MVEIDLRHYGAGIFNCRGTEWSKRLEGQRLLLLFGERHSVKPFIHETLLNVIDLDKLGVLSCVGVEGNPRTDIPGWEAEQAFNALPAAYAGDDERIVESMLAKLCDSHFWKTLRLMRPNLVVESVDDEKLHDEAMAPRAVIRRFARKDLIDDRLRKSELFQSPGWNPTTDERERNIQAKVDLQFEQEVAEEEVNVARDSKMLGNLWELWERFGTGKMAVLIAGSSHQWRIARQLPLDVSYYHIEQP